MKKTIIILTVLLFAFPTDAVAGDREDLVAAIEKRWIDTAKKQISLDDSNPAGAWLATSQGGLWQFQNSRRDCNYDHRFTKYSGF